MPGRVDAPPASERRVLVVACGALARELLEVVRANGLHSIDVECLPASYHNTPDVIPDAVAERVRSAADRYERIFVGYGDCGTGGRLDAVCEELDVERLPGDHCYEFLTGGAAFAELHAEELGTFFLTDYLVKHFDRLVVRAFWLDTHPELRSQVFANYRRLVYLAQTDDPDLVERARAGEGPSLLVVRTYRMMGHSSSDDPTQYRDAEEVEAWAARDPLVRFGAFLRDRGVLDAGEEQSIEDDLYAEIDAEIHRQESSPPMPLKSLVEDIYAEVPAHLRKQYNSFIRVAERLGDARAGDGEFPL